MRASRTKPLKAKRYIDCHPKAGIATMPTTAAMEPPIGTPDIITVAITDRRRGETNSDVKALAEGTRPPSPSPARKRSAPKTSGDVANPQRPVNTVNQATQRDDRAATAEAVGEAAGGQGTDEHADEGEAADRACRRRGELPARVGEQGGDGGPVDDEVVAVEDDDQPAQRDDQRRGALTGRVGDGGGCSRCGHGHNHPGVPSGRTADSAEQNMGSERPWRRR